MTNSLSKIEGKGCNAFIVPKTSEGLERFKTVFLAEM